MRALITGITGFVGSHLAEHLLSQRWQVAGFTRRGQWHPQVDSSLHQIPIMNWDMQYEPNGSVIEWVQNWNPGLVFHLAAISIPADCGVPEPNSLAWETNVTGTLRMLELLKRVGFTGRLIFASSCHVYAPVSEESSVVDEGSPIGPVNGYGKTKLAAEKLVEEAVAEGWDAITVRGFQVTGPRQSPRLILPEWAQQIALEKETVTIRTRNTSLDLMDVRDNSRALQLIAERAPGGSVMNVGSGTSTHGQDLIDSLEQVATYQPNWNEVAPGSRQNPIASIQRLQEFTDFRPEIQLKQTVADVCRGFQI